MTRTIRRAKAVGTLPLALAAAALLLAPAATMQQ